MPKRATTSARRSSRKSGASRRPLSSVTSPCNVLQNTSVSGPASYFPATGSMTARSSAKHAFITSGVPSSANRSSDARVNIAS